MIRFPLRPANNISIHTAVGWEEFCQRVLQKFSTIRSKVDGSLPKPHWGKVNKVRSYARHLLTCVSND